MRLTIVLRKEVPDEQTAQALLDTVAEKLADYTDIEVSGQVNQSLLLTPPTP